MKTKEPYDIAIIGAGVAGSVLAANLAKLNFKIAIVEKKVKKIQDRIVGELLQPGGVALLKEMGLSFLLDDIDAQEVTGYTLFLEQNRFSIPYSKEKNLKAISFRNSKFIINAQNYISQLDNIDLIEGDVTELIEENNKIKGFNYKKKEKDFSIYANLTFICEGPAAKLRKKAATDNKKIKGFFVGIVLEDCPLPVPNNGHVILSGESPILIYPISSNENRLLIDFPGNKPPKMNKEFKSYLINNVKAKIPEELHIPFDKAIEKGNFKSMPNQNMKAIPFKKDDVLLLGDSYNMRHPLTGGGMSATFNDIKNITKYFKKINTEKKPNFTQIIKDYYKKRIKDVANINILADSLYHATRDDNLKVASFNYLKQESNQKETIEIIAGINKNRYKLIQQFIMVVFSGINKLKLSKTKKIILLSKSSKIIIPLILQEGDPKLYKITRNIIDKFIK